MAEALPPPLPPPSPYDVGGFRPWFRRSGLLAIILAAVVAVVEYVTFTYQDGDYFLFAILLLPPAAGALAVILVDPWGRRGVSADGILALKVTAGILVVGGATGPGVICLLIGSPVIALTCVLGAITAGALLRTFRRRSVPGLMLFMPLLVYATGPVEQFEHRQLAETTVIEIAAPPEAVWRNTLTMRDISPRERAWTVSHDLLRTPGPVDARLDGEGVGAVRHVRWEHGVHFQEHITAWEPARHLAWKFVFAPDSIPRAIEGHMRLDSDYLHIARGEYRLEPVAGGTRLTLTTHYAIATPYNAYAAWWGRLFLQDFHAAVLEVIRIRSEAVPAMAAIGN